MVLHIKNMVCNRCNWVVKSELEKMGFEVEQVALGEAVIKENPDDTGIDRIAERLETFGFELINDKSAKLIEAVKRHLIELTNNHDLLGTANLSQYLSSALHKDYSVISKLFSESESITLEQYYILQKIEKAKEWLVYGEMNLTEIAWQLGYSSVAHLSAQFKKVTGLTPTHFRNLRDPLRKSIDRVSS
jgi:AraC family transcriptional regulator